MGRQRKIKGKLNEKNERKPERNTRRNGMKTNENHQT